MWETIKNILKKNRGTCIIIEEGKPAYVVTAFEDYQHSLEDEPLPESRPGVISKDSRSESELLQRINQEIADWTAQQAASAASDAASEPETELAESVEEPEVRIENLPLV